MKKLFILLCLACSCLANAWVFEEHGDSTKSGFTIENGVGKVAEFTPTELLRMMINEKCGYGVHTVLNKSYGGSSAQSARTTGLYEGKTFAQYMQTSPANVVIANWGINDNFIPGNSKWLYTYDHTLNAQAAQAAGKVYIAETSHPTAYYPPRDALIWEWSNTLATYGPASNYPVIDMWSAVNSGLPSYAQHLPDGIHGSQTLYFIKALIVYRYLKSHGYVC